MFITLYHIILMHVRCRGNIKAFLISSSKPVLLGNNNLFYKNLPSSLEKLINCAMRCIPLVQVKRSTSNKATEWTALLGTPLLNPGLISVPSPPLKPTCLIQSIHLGILFVKYDVRYILNCKSKNTFIMMPVVPPTVVSISQMRKLWRFARVIMHRSWSTSKFDRCMMQCISDIHWHSNVTVLLPVCGGRRCLGQNTHNRLELYKDNLKGQMRPSLSCITNFRFFFLPTWSTRRRRRSPIPVPGCIFQK